MDTHTEHDLLSTLGKTRGGWGGEVMLCQQTVLDTPPTHSFQRLTSAAYEVGDIYIYGILVKDISDIKR